MPFKLSWAERQIFLNHAWGPGPILDLLAPLAFKTIHAASKLDLFNLLKTSGPLSVVDICKKLKADEFGTKLLLETLCSLGYVRRKGESCFVNSVMTDTWMVKNGTADCSGMFGYFDDAYLRWSELHNTILAGKPAERADLWLDRHEGSWERYHDSLRAIAELMAGQIVLHAALPAGVKRLIDIGGSHGLYSVRFCRHYQRLSAVILDEIGRASCRERV
jgi:hypothetical protein